MTHSSDRFSSASVVRRTFLDFFAGKGHEEVASSSLVPQNDPTLLFANAGMNQFKDVFTGKARRLRSRATTSQKCVRAGGKHNDLENVGRTARHHTFFEMLGNFSFGDYFKEGAITFAHELLIEVYGLSLPRLVFTVHHSDDEARQLWKSIAGVSDNQIISLGDKDNFWAMGDTGPCGPCSEIHYHQGDDLPCSEEAAGRLCQGPACDCDRWVEIWNLVFMQFDQLPDGTRAALPRPSVDTGMGLERLCAVLQGKRSNYETDLLSPLIATAATLANKSFDPTDFRENSPSVSLRAIADHARATAFLVADGVFPEKTRREYVLRRIMRRAIYHGDLLGIKQHFFAGVTGQVIDLMSAAYPELEERRGTIVEVAEQEERRFRETLDRGVRILTEEAHKLTGSAVPGELAFRLYDTYGFPLDLTRVIAMARGLGVDEAGFDLQMEAQRKRASFVGSGELAVESVFQTIADRVGATKFLGYESTHAPGMVVALVTAGAEVQTVAMANGAAPVTFAFVCMDTPFYGESGGQMGDIGTAEGPAGSVRILDTKRPVPGLTVHLAELIRGEVKVGDALDMFVDTGNRNAIARNHSATHLLHWALRKTLGEHVAQKGSLVSTDKLRFDFSHFAPLTRGEKERVEDLVNARVVENHAVQTEVLPVAQAKAAGAMAFFGEKYSDTVRVLSMAESKELCGGTHVTRTGDIGLFKITEEAGVAQGVRRVEAVTGAGATQFVRRLEHELLGTAEQLKASPFEVAAKVERLGLELRLRDKEIDKLRSQLASGGGKDLAAQAQKVGGVSLLVADVPVGDPKILRETADKLRDTLNPCLVVLVGTEGDKLSIVCVVSKDAQVRFHAGKILADLVKAIDGKGGGRPDMAQGGGTKPADVPALFGHLARHIGRTGGPELGMLPLPDAGVIEAAKAVYEAIRSSNRSDPASLPDMGFDDAFFERITPLLEFLWTRYFRVKITGLQNIPATGPAVLVANHSGGLPYDGMLLAYGVRKLHSAHRLPRPLVANFAFRSRLMAPVVARFGGVRASMENATKLLAQNQLISVFPEGLRGVGKLYRERYRLTRFGRGGFVRLATTTGVPIIPTAIVGAEEIHPVLGKLTRPARWLGLPYLPITPTFPFLGPLGLMPLPTKWTIRIGKPIVVSPMDVNSPSAVLEAAEKVRTQVDTMIAEMLLERRSIFFG